MEMGARRRRGVKRLGAGVQTTIGGPRFVFLLLDGCQHPPFWPGPCLLLVTQTQCDAHSGECRVLLIHTNA